MEQIIYNTEHAEYRIGPVKYGISIPVKYGICMATFQRKNGKTPMYLKKSFEALLKQTATNWHLYLVGDKYEDNEEFIRCISTFPKEKITAINLPTAPERENIKNVNQLHSVAGCNAFNKAIELALADGCEYILHHDDDDPFHVKKVQILNYVLSEYIDPTCIFHYSTHLNNTILPREKITNISKNNLRPMPGNVIHTSLCIHKSVASVFRYDGYRPNKIEYECGDIQLINYLSNLIVSDSKNYTVFVPLVLCSHDIEGEERDTVGPNILKILEENTEYTSNLVNNIASTMKGNTFHHHFHILYTLRSLINKEVATYMEIGTFNGGSLCLMLQHPSPVQCISIDPFHLDRTAVAIVKENIAKFNKYNYNVVLTNKFSTDISLIEDLQKNQVRVDILFIDGDHSFNSILHDFDVFQNFVEVGGYIVFDDYCDKEHSPEVRGAVDTIVDYIIKNNLNFEIIGNPTNYKNVHPSEFQKLNEYIIRKK